MVSCLQASGLVAPTSGSLQAIPIFNVESVQAHVAAAMFAGQCTTTQVAAVLGSLLSLLKTANDRAPACPARPVHAQDGTRNDTMPKGAHGQLPAPMFSQHECGIPSARNMDQHLFAPRIWTCTSPQAPPGVWFASNNREHFVSGVSNTSGISSGQDAPELYTAPVFSHDCSQNVNGQEALRTQNATRGQKAHGDFFTAQSGEEARRPLSRLPSKVACRLYSSSGTCKYGDSCWFSHQVQRAVASAHTSSGGCSKDDVCNPSEIIEGEASHDAPFQQRDENDLQTVGKKQDNYMDPSFCDYSQIAHADVGADDGWKLVGTHADAAKVKARLQVHSRREIAASIIQRAVRRHLCGRDCTIAAESNVSDRDVYEGDDSNSQDATALNIARIWARLTTVRPAPFADAATELSKKQPGDLMLDEQPSDAVRDGRDPPAASATMETVLDRNSPGPKPFSSFGQNPCVLPKPSVQKSGRNLFSPFFAGSGAAQAQNGTNDSGGSTTVAMDGATADLVVLPADPEASKKEDKDDKSANNSGEVKDGVSGGIAALTADQEVGTGSTTVAVDGATADRLVHPADPEATKKENKDDESVNNLGEVKDGAFGGIAAPTDDQEKSVDTSKQVQGGVGQGSFIVPLVDMGAYVSNSVLKVCSEGNGDREFKFATHPNLEINDKESDNCSVFHSSEFEGECDDMYAEAARYLDNHDSSEDDIYDQYRQMLAEDAESEKTSDELWS